MDGKKICSHLILFVVYMTRYLSEGCEPVSVLDGKTIDMLNDFKGTVLAESDTTEEDCNKDCCATEKCIIALYDTRKGQCTLLDCDPVDSCPIKDSKRSVLTYFGEVHDAMVTTQTTSTTTGKTTQTDVSTVNTLTDKNTSTKESTSKLNTDKVDYSTNTSKTSSGSISEQSTEIASSFISTSPSSTLSSGSLTASATSLPSLTTTQSIAHTANGSSLSPSTSIILTAITTSLPTGENISLSTNESAVSALNETLQIKTNTTEIDENKVTVENNTLETIVQNVSTTSKVNANPEQVNGTTALATEEPAQGTSETTLSKFSTLPSTATASTWWLLNGSSVPSSLTLPTTTVSKLSTTSLSSSSMPVSGNTLPLATSTSASFSTATIESSTNSSNTSTTSGATTSSTLSSLGTSPFSFFWTSTFPPISSSMSSSTSGSNQTDHGKLSGSAKQDQMSGTLIAALCIGIILTFAIAVLFVKRVFDAWQRRHYNKLDYLINGMYG